MRLADVAWVSGRVADGIEHSRAAVRAAAEEPLHARRLYPRLLLATVLTDMRQLDEAEAVLQAATEEITARGHTAYAASPAVFRARLRLAEGRLDDAVAEAEAGLAMADEMGMHLFDPMGNIVLAIVALQRGDIDAAARRVACGGPSNLAGHGPLHAWGWAAWATARIADAQGDQKRAVDILQAPYTDPQERAWLLTVEPNAAGLADPYGTRRRGPAGRRSHRRYRREPRPGQSGLPHSGRLGRPGARRPSPGRGVPGPRRRDPRGTVEPRLGRRGPRRSALP